MPINFTIEQAYDAISNKTDPWMNSQLVLQFSPMMIRSQMTMNKYGTDRDYLILVQKDHVGVSGTIEVKTYDADIISGTFSGTLGYWTPTQDLEMDPPVVTM